MPNRIVLAVGGSGQMVLHYYLLLRLVGAVRSSEERGLLAYVIDSDEPLQSLQWLSSFWGHVRHVLGTHADLAGIPELRLIKLRPGEEGCSVADILGGPTLLQALQTPGFRHAAQAFFSREALAQDVRSGLFARPALSAVMRAKELLEGIDCARWDPGSRVVLTCSCIGGTGAGLAIPLLWHLAGQPDRAFEIRAVFLGEFFRPREGSTVGKDVQRFRSNRLGFLKAAELSLAARLTHYAWVEDSKPQDRDPDKEKKAQHLPLPGSESPYWKATCALHYLLTETVQAVARNFVDRCVAESNYIKTPDYDDAEAHVRKALGRVQQAIRKRLLRRLAWEANASGMWGRKLVEGLIALYRISRNLGATWPPQDFLLEVQDSMTRIWTGQPYGLVHLFPALESLPASPREIRESAWIFPSDDARPEGFGNHRRASELVASLLLSCLVRGGG